MNDKVNPIPTNEAVDENHIIAERREKLAKLREGGVAFPNDFVPTHLAADLHTHYDSLSKEELAAKISMDRTYIGLIERGGRNPTVRTLYKIAKALKVNSSELLPF